jgi:hypothetical protein
MECSKDAVPIAEHHDWLVNDLERDIAAGRTDSVVSSDAEPGFREDMVEFEPKHIGVAVVAAREGVPVALAARRVVNAHAHLRSCLS